MKKKALALLSFSLVAYAVFAQQKVVKADPVVIKAILAHTQAQYNIAAAKKMGYAEAQHLAEQQFEVTAGTIRHWKADHGVGKDWTFDLKNKQFVAPKGN